jgi:hypothetical protein
MKPFPPLPPALCLLVTLAVIDLTAEERRERFDRDPGWDGHNNRSAKPETIRQDFGWSAGTTNAGGAAGEIGGSIHPAAEPAYYAKPIGRRTFNDGLSASGIIRVEPGSGHTLLGFFNAQSLNEWRTRNTLALRIQQRGDLLHCHFEHGTSKWRAGAGIIGQYDKVRDRMNPRELPCGQSYPWSLRYDPHGPNGSGIVTATLGGETAQYEISAEHRADGAEFTHFGLVNVLKQFDSPGKLWLDEVTVLGERETFARDPSWDASGNRRSYDTRVVRPRFDFGFSATRHAGGQAAGELGGLFFRGDCRHPERLAAYGDRLSLLNLDRPLRAAGKVVLRRGVSDSTTLIGFYHSTESLKPNPSQKFGTPRHFLGAAVEGPSSEGFYFYPSYRNGDEGVSVGMWNTPPRIYPDGVSHDWSLHYQPEAAGGRGAITVTLDGQVVTLMLNPGDKAAGAQFDRFGLVTPWIDGNGQHVYFDDLSYTCRQE